MELMTVKLIGVFFCRSLSNEIIPANNLVTQSTLKTTTLFGWPFSFPRGWATIQGYEAIACGCGIDRAWLACCVVRAEVLDAQLTHAVDANRPSGAYPGFITTRLFAQQKQKGPGGPEMRDDECLAAIKGVLVTLTDRVLREQYTEISALSVLVAACKNARPAEAALLDQLLETARNSEDIKKAVDVKIESILKMLRSLDLSNLEQVSQALMRLDAQSKIVN
jgi:hypothetical protein